MFYNNSERSWGFLQEKSAVYNFSLYPGQLNAGTNLKAGSLQCSTSHTKYAN
jgi:hypothetical protein